MIGNQFPSSLFFLSFRFSSTGDQYFHFYKNHTQVLQEWQLGTKGSKSWLWLSELDLACTGKKYSRDRDWPEVHTLRNTALTFDIQDINYGSHCAYYLRHCVWTKLFFPQCT
jgi:hypothetical protein